MTAPVSREKAFEVFEDPRNLAQITPKWLNFSIATPGEITMRAGAEIEYTIRWLGFRIRWKTVIDRYEPPRLFIDEQTRGPYSMWRHRHDFQDTAGGTIISDCVDYRLPFGLMGEIAHALVIKRQLIEIFRFRQREIARLMKVSGVSCGEPRVSRIG